MKINLFKTKKTQIHFLHIGKTGGTSLNSLISSIDNYNSNFKYHDHSFTLKNVPKNDLAIFFLRNPIDRFISAFYSRLREGKPKYDVPWNEKEKKAFQRFKTPNELALALSSTNSSLYLDALDAMSNLDT